MNMTKTELLIHILPNLLLLQFSHLSKWHIHQSRCLRQTLESNLPLLSLSLPIWKIHPESVYFFVPLLLPPGCKTLTSLTRLSQQSPKCLPDYNPLLLLHKPILNTATRNPFKISRIMSLKTFQTSNMTPDKNHIHSSCLQARNNLPVLIS